MLYHMIAFEIGYILDLLIGDPYNLPHPIRLIGNLIAYLDKLLINQSNRNKKQEKAKGLFLVLIVLILTLSVTSILVMGAYLINVYVGVAVEAVLTCYILATKSLRDESMIVYKDLQNDDVEAARKSVSMIVGRDTNVLDRDGIIKATVETVAENTSDGVIAPLLYTFLGGPILGLTYKAINTMDSMVGYHNERYENLGFFAAKLDDVVNYLPARISALIMLVVSGMLGKDYNPSNGLKIFFRDRYKHKSPNSAQTESACAGILGLRLAGDAVYFGKVLKKDYIGDALRNINAEDIVRVNRLMYSTSIFTFLICSIMLLIVVLMRM